MRTQDERRGYVMAVNNGVGEMIDVATGQTFDVTMSAPGGVLAIVGDQWVFRREESGVWAFERCVTMAARQPEKTFADSLAMLKNKGILDPSYSDGYPTESHQLAHIGQIRWFALPTPPNDKWLRCDGAALNRAKYRDLARIIDPLGTSVTFLAPLVADAETLNKTAWANAAFTAPWTNYGVGFNPVQYRRVGDKVELQGLANNGTTAANGQTIHTLPVGFRPLTIPIFTVLVSDLKGRVDVSPSTGAVTVQNGIAAVNAWVTLDNLSFYSPSPTTPITVRPYVCARK